MCTSTNNTKGLLHYWLVHNPQPNWASPRPDDTMAWAIPTNRYISHFFVKRNVIYKKSTDHRSKSWAGHLHNNIPFKNLVWSTI